jgi:hypothetical protein
VLARVTDMMGINIGLFDFDRHNAIYYFVLNADEEIYLRYGGRDADSATTYLNGESFDLALQLALEKHQKPREKRPKVKSFYPRDIVSLKEAVVETNRCVECHLIADYQAVELEELGEFFKPRDMYLSPDLKEVGIELDVPRGLVVKSGPGLKEGDLITGLNGSEVLTFADLQYQLNKVKREARKVELKVVRGRDPFMVEIPLKLAWWVTDLRHRHWTVDPQLYFDAEPLGNEEKRALKLPLDGFASKVRSVWVEAIINEAHSLEKGDVIMAVAGERVNPLTINVTTHLKLMVKAGGSTILSVLRDGKEIELSLKTGRPGFRK